MENSAVCSVKIDLSRILAQDSIDHCLVHPVLETVAKVPVLVVLVVPVDALKLVRVEQGWTPWVAQGNVLVLPQVRRASSLRRLRDVGGTDRPGRHHRGHEDLHRAERPAVDLRTVNL